MAFPKLRINLNPMAGFRKIAQARTERNLRAEEAKGLLKEIYNLGENASASISHKTTVSVGSKKFALHTEQALEALKKLHGQVKRQEVKSVDTLARQSQEGFEKAIQTYVQSHNKEYAHGVKIPGTGETLEFEKERLTNAPTLAGKIWGFFRRRTAQRKAAA